MAETTARPGERVRAARQLAGLSQRRLSALIGAKHSYVAQIEAGLAKEPGATYLVRLAKALGVTSEWLMSGEGQAPTARRVKAAVAAAARAQAAGGAS